LFKLTLYAYSSSSNSSVISTIFLITILPVSCE